jgi:hypothetical protein
MTSALRQFADDATLQAMLVLILLDLVLGIAAAVKLGVFSFAKVAGFLRDDVLGKVIPWFAVYAAWKIAPSVDVLGVDLEVIEKGVFAACVIALVGSLMSSLSDLGINLPNPLARGENTTNTGTVVVNNPPPSG